MSFFEARKTTGIEEIDQSAYLDGSLSYKLVTISENLNDIVKDFEHNNLIYKKGVKKFKNQIVADQMPSLERFNEILNCYNKDEITWAISEKDHNPDLKILLLRRKILGEYSWFLYYINSAITSCLWELRNTIHLAQKKDTLLTESYDNFLHNCPNHDGNYLALVFNDSHREFIKSVYQKNFQISLNPLETPNFQKLDVSAIILYFLLLEIDENISNTRDNLDLAETKGDCYFDLALKLQISGKFLANIDLNFRNAHECEKFIDNSKCFYKALSIILGQKLPTIIKSQS